MDNAERIAAIEDILRADVDRAQVRYRSEAAKFRQIRQDIPSGIPHPDGVMRIRQSGEAHSAALAAYISALKRFTDFVVKRVVPNDLNGNT